MVRCSSEDVEMIWSWYGVLQKRISAWQRIRKRKKIHEKWYTTYAQPWYTILIIYCNIIELFTSLLTFWLLKLSLFEGGWTIYEHKKCVLFMRWMSYSSLGKPWWGSRPHLGKLMRFAPYPWLIWIFKKGGKANALSCKCLDSKEREETEFNSSVELYWSC